MIENYNIKISIIVPVYNAEKYIKKCLSSIQKQEFGFFQVIVVNDGSKDGSMEVINEFIEDERFSVIDKPNGGASSARNAGLERAVGEYVCFIDSDDWIQPLFLKSLYSAAGPDIDVVVGRYTLKSSVLNKSIIMGAENKKEKLFSGKDKEEKILYKHIGPFNRGEKECFQDTLMCVWKNLYRRKLLSEKHIIFKSQLLILEDYEFNLQVYYYANKIAFDDNAEYIHLTVENSLSKSYHPNLCHMMINLYDICYDFIDKNKFYNKEKATNQLENFLEKSVVDICYNTTYAAKSEINVLLNNILQEPKIEHVIYRGKKLEVPFYYRFFLLLIRHKQIGLLKYSMLLSRKLNYFYMTYRSFKK